MRVSVFAADPLMGEGLASLLKYAGGFTVSSREGRLDRATLSGPRPVADVLIVTEDLLDEEGINSLNSFLRHTPMKVVVLAKDDHGLNVDAVLDSSLGSSEIFATLRAISLGVPTAHAPAPAAAENVPYRMSVDGSGKPIPVRLSPREKDVARMIAKGLGNRAIAEQLGIQEQSIKNCVSTLMTKLGCVNRVQVLLRVQGTDLINQS